MTVRELISELSKYPQDMEVLSYEYCEIRTVEEEKLKDTDEVVVIVN